MLYELRIYEIVPGRNKALVDRFANIALFHFKKNGLKPVLFAEPFIGTTNQLVYLLEWESMDAMQKGWVAMGSDSEWIAKRNETETDGPIVARTTNTVLRDVPPIMSRVKELWG